MQKTQKVGRPRKYLVLYNKEAVTALLEGFTPTQLAIEIGCKDTSVWEAIKRHGIKLRYRWRVKENMENLYVTQGMGIQQIATHLNISIRTVYVWLDKHGIPRRGQLGLKRGNYKRNSQRTPPASV